METFGITRGPSAFQDLSDPSGQQGQVYQEILVGSLGSIGRLPKRCVEDPLNEGEIEIVQERSVEEEGAALAALGITGELAASQSEIACSLGFDRRSENWLQRGTVASEDETGCVLDVPEGAGFWNGEHKREVQAAGTDEYGSATAGAPQNRNVQPLTLRVVDVSLRLGRGAEDDAMHWRLPESKCRPMLAAVAFVKQAVVEFEVFLG